MREHEDTGISPETWGLVIAIFISALVFGAAVYLGTPKRVVIVRGQIVEFALMPGGRGPNRMAKVEAEGRQIYLQAPIDSDCHLWQWVELQKTTRRSGNTYNFTAWGCHPKPSLRKVSA